MEKFRSVEDCRKAFGEALCNRRLDNGLSQTALGEQLGVGQSAVSSWELGESEPPVEKVYLIEDILKVPPGVLSQHLGWLPLHTGRRRPPQRVLDVLDSDPTYDEEGKRILRAVCRELRKKR